MERVPWNQLSSDALRNIIMDVVTREGTDVHDSDVFDPETTYQQVLARLTADELVLVFDSISGTCNIVHPDAIPDD